MNLLVYLVVAAAGIGFLSVIILSWINEYLYEHGWSVIDLERTFTALLKTQQPLVAEREGFITLLFSGWFTTLGFLFLWLIPFFQSFVQYAFIGALLYCFCAWIIIMLLLLPLANKGFFGKRHHNHVPFSTGLLLFIYAVLLAMLVPAII